MVVFILQSASWAKQKINPYRISSGKCRPGNVQLPGKALPAEGGTIRANADSHSWMKGRNSCIEVLDEEALAC